MEVIVKYGPSFEKNVPSRKKEEEYLKLRKDGKNWLKGDLIGGIGDYWSPYIKVLKVLYFFHENGKNRTMQDQVANRKEVEHGSWKWIDTNKETLILGKYIYNG